jgi:hypothetical protein
VKSSRRNEIRKAQVSFQSPIFRAYSRVDLKRKKYIRIDSDFLKFYLKSEFGKDFLSQNYFISKKIRGDLV